MTEDMFVGVGCMFMVLCITIYKMHENWLKYRKDKEDKK